MSFEGSQVEKEESKKGAPHLESGSDYMAPTVDFLSYEPNFLFKEFAKD